MCAFLDEDGMMMLKEYEASREEMGDRMDLDDIARVEREEVEICRDFLNRVKRLNFRIHLEKALQR